MELLNQFRKNGYFTAQLYHLLAKKKVEVSPEAVIIFELVDIELINP